MRSTLWCLVLAVAPAVAIGGCASDEPRELGQADSGRLEDQQQAGTQELDESLASNALDGKTFVVELKMPDAAPVQDELIFADGTFDSTACHAKGFKDAPYAALGGEGGISSFNAVTTSGEKSARWNGAVQGDTIKGTVVIEEPGKEPIYGTFDGVVKGGTQYRSSWGDGGGHQGGVHDGMQGGDHTGEEGDLGDLHGPQK